MDPTEDDSALGLNEPDEFDPDSLGPQVDIPEPPDFSEADVSTDLYRTFWIVVVMAKIGLLATSLGGMIIIFQGRLQFGGSILAVGVLALIVGYRRYRNYQNG